MIGKPDEPLFLDVTYETRIAGMQKICDWCNAGRYFGFDRYITLRDDLENLTTGDLTGIQRDNIFQISIRGFNMRNLTVNSLASFLTTYNETQRMLRECLESEVVKNKT